MRREHIYEYQRLVLNLRPNCYESLDIAEMREKNLDQAEISYSRNNL